MPASSLADESVDRHGRSKDNALLPSINHNGSMLSYNGSDSPGDCARQDRSFSRTSRSQSLSRSVSNATNTDSYFRLPSIDRSKTNSICSFASSNISAATNASLNPKDKRRRQKSDTDHSAGFPELNGDANNNESPVFESITPQQNGDNSGGVRPGNQRHRSKGKEAKRQKQEVGDVKLPDIFSSKNSSDGSPMSSPSPTLRQQNKLNKKKSSSLQDLADQFRREESVLGNNYKNFIPSPKSSKNVEAQDLFRAESKNSMTIRSSLPTPVLFPMREDTSRASRKSKTSVKRGKDKSCHRENHSGFKDNDLQDVIEKLEAFSHLDNDSEGVNARVMGKTNSLQQVREETEYDKYVYANGYDHPGSDRKSRTRAQSEDRRSAKVH